MAAKIEDMFSFDIWLHRDCLNYFLKQGVLLEQGDRLVGRGWSFVLIITALFFIFCPVFSNSKSVLFFYRCLKIRFPNIEVNPGPRAAPQCCRVMFTNINGLHGNRYELAIAATEFDVVACAETKVTGRKHVSRLLLPGFKAPTLLLRGARLNGLGMALFWSFCFAAGKVRVFLL